MPWRKDGDDGPELPFTPEDESGTSEAAARDAKPTAQTQRIRVFQCIHDSQFGLTDDELEVRTGLIGSTVRPRRRELQLAKRIAHYGSYRPTRTGRKAKVWEVRR